LSRASINKTEIPPLYMANDFIVGNWHNPALNDYDVIRDLNSAG